MPEPFCYWQVKCEEDTEDTWTCTAHMAEARAYACHFASLADAKDNEKHQYVCQDAKPPELKNTKSKGDE